MSERPEIIDRELNRRDVAERERRNARVEAYRRQAAAERESD